MLGDLARPYPESMFRPSRQQALDDLAITSLRGYRVAGPGLAERRHLERMRDESHGHLIILHSGRSAETPATGASPSRRSSEEPPAKLDHMRTPVARHRRAHASDSRRRGPALVPAKRIADPNRRSRFTPLPRRAIRSRCARRSALRSKAIASSLLTDHGQAAASTATESPISALGRARRAKRGPRPDSMRRPVPGEDRLRTEGRPPS